MVDNKHCTAVEGFVRQMCVSTLASFEAMAQGTHLYEALAKVAPLFFADGATKLQTDGLEANWVLRKSNLSVLAADMNAFARTALSALDDFDVLRLVDIAAVAKLQGPPSSENGGAVDGLATLADMVFVCCVLSGSQDAIGVIKALPKEDQSILNQTAKKAMGLYGLKPAKKGATPASSMTPTVASPAGRMPSMGSMGGDGSMEGAVLHNEVVQLRNELKDRQASIHELEARVELSERERTEAQERYRTLLESMEHERSSGQSEKQWLQQISKKDDTIRQLTTTVDSMTAKMASIKERGSALEDDMEAMRTKLAQSELLLRERTEEKQEVATQLSILQDRYDANSRAKAEVNDELQALKNELDNLRANAAVAKANEAQHQPTQEGGRGDESFQLTLEEENADIKEQLAAARSELALLKKSGLLSHGGNTTPRRDALDGSYMDDESPAGRTVLGHGGEAHQPSSQSEEASKLQSELAAAQASLSLRDNQIATLEKQMTSLEGHLQRSLSELEDVKEQNIRLESERSAGAATVSASSNDLKKEMEALKKHNSEMHTRLAERSEATRKEQAILVSTVVQYGHKNLMLQQRQLLAAAGGSGGKAAAAAAVPGSGNVLSSLNAWLLGAPTQDVTEIAGSFLTKHRRALERGLLDSLLTAPVAAPPQPPSSHHHRKS